MTTAAALAVGGLAIAFNEATGQPITAVLFSGQNAFEDLAKSESTLSLSTLTLLLLFKGLAWGISLGNFRGGPAFPALFLGASAGVLAAHLPGLAQTPAVAALMAAGCAAVLRLPLSSVVITLVLVSQAGVGLTSLIVVAAVVAFVTVEALDGLLRRVREPAPAEAPRFDPPSPPGEAVAMGQGISEVLAFAVGVAISPAAIIAVILMLFSRRAEVNGPLFLLGWVGALGGLVAVVYAISDQSNAATNNTSSDSVSWLKIVLGASFLLLARREWRKRPAPGAESEMPKWMTRVDALTPAQSLGLGVLLGGLNPKNLALGIGAAAGVAQLGLSTADAVVSLIVFVAVGSLTIVGPVVYYLLGGAKAKTELDELKDWLGRHNDAVMAVLFVVLGAALIAKGLAPLTK